MNQNGKSSNRRQLARLGESTQNMLSFQDMMSENKPITAQDAPMDRLRLPRKPYRTAADHQPFRPTPLSQGKFHVASHDKKPTTAAVPQEICLPPLGSGVSSRRSRTSCTDHLVPQPRQEQWHRTMVDVMPGYSVPMAGTQETMHALDRDHCTDTACVQCETFLYCIDSANMVLCPLCRSISPVSSTGAHSETLGLGLTVEHILEARVTE
jgi:hypothetical protein